MIALLLLACTGEGPGVGQPQDDSVPAGAATFSAEELVWTGLTAGFSEIRTLDVTNAGAGPLDVTEATIVTDPASVFSVDFAALTLDPGASATIEVAALLAEDGPASGELRVRTSDPAAAAPIFALTVE